MGPMGPMGPMGLIRPIGSPLTKLTRRRRRFTLAGSPFAAAAALDAKEHIMRHAKLGLTLLALALVIAVGSAAPQAPDAANADEQREQQVMNRFLSVLEKNPRRGTALDRLYGYHVERGT